MRFVLIPAGGFIMGSPSDEPEREQEEIQHDVTGLESFFLGQYEVTQKEWQKVMGSKPSFFLECGPECPVEGVNFFEVMDFIKRLNDLSGESFRLPTEAEWEYACRAGSLTPFSTGDNLTTDQANYDGRYPYSGHSKSLYRASPTPVGSFPPNGWGLHDMHGNVWEWTSDWHCTYPNESNGNPASVCNSELKVIRGGSWYFGADSARCALRYTHRPQDKGFSIGFRLVRNAVKRHE
jgi:formylglycine-generating enzyme required for sulfatase activity